MLIRSKKEVFNVTLCNTLLSQFLGLMFNFPKNDGLLFDFKREKFISLHMFFVFFSIDLVYLNNKKEIIKIVKNVKPFTPYIKSVKCRYIMELKDSKNLQQNDK